MAEDGLADAGNRAEALRRFFGVLDRHEERIRRTKGKVDAIYAFKTPGSPYVEYGITENMTSVFQPYEYRRSSWAATEHEKRLDAAMQRIAWNLEALPQSDAVPTVHPGHGTSDLIPRLFGCEFDVTAEGAVLNRNYRITDLGRDIEGVMAQEIDPLADPRVRDQVEFTGFAAGLLQGRVPVVYPQMQGLLTNSMRIMEQSEMLVACVQDRESLGRLARKIGRIMIRIIQALQKAAGGPENVRPRGRFHQPSWIRGLQVDDYLSVIRPEDYEAICTPAWREMTDALGPIYMHTCGPVAHALDMIRRLPGLAGFETAFVNGQSTTTREIRAAKSRLHGKLVFSTFGLPHGEPASDGENFTREWLDGMSAGGGYMLHAYGRLEEGRRLFERLGIG